MIHVRRMVAASLIVVGSVGGCGKGDPAERSSAYSVEGTVVLASAPLEPPQGLVSTSYDLVIQDEKGLLWECPRDVLWPRGTQVRLSIAKTPTGERAIEILVVSSPPGLACRPKKWPFSVPGVPKPGEMHYGDSRRK
jgi:hypothetical protein